MLIRPRPRRPSVGTSSLSLPLKKYTDLAQEPSASAQMSELLKTCGCSELGQLKVTAQKMWVQLQL